MPRVMLALVLLVCVVGIGAGIAVAASRNAGTEAVLHSPATIPASATANQAAAQADASWLLTQVSLPPNATRSAGEPTGDEGQLAHPGAGPAATPNVVDSHAWWVLPGVRNEVLAYIRTHPPAGTTIAFSGSAATRGSTTSESIAFAWPPIADTLGMRWLVITVVQLPGGQTGLRADAQVVWITPRPASETIPGAQLLRISVHSAIAVNQPHQRSLRFTSGHKIAQVIALLNSLPVAQPGVTNCPADFGISIRLAFYPTSRDSPSAVAEIDPQGCGGVGLTLNGRPQPRLSSELPSMPGQPPTGSLVGRIDHTLGVKLRVTPSR
jgi:hypothetical protein